MLRGERIQRLIRVAGLTTALVFMQQLVATALFGLPFDWSAMPGFVLVNFGIVAGWFYFKDPDRKIPMFAVVIAAVCFAIWLRAALIYLGLFRLISPYVVAFLERPIAIIAAFVSTPQLAPAMLAALILLLLMPKAKEAYRKFASNGFFVFNR